MLEGLIELDHTLSLAINSWNSSWADVIMSFLSNRFVWIPFYVLFIVWLCGIYRKKVFWVLLGVVLLIAVADYTSVHLFKNVFCRLRPCHEPTLEGLIRIPNGCGGLYGFISSHAVNHFALAVYLSMWFTKAWQKRKQFRGNIFYKGLGFYRYGGLYLWAVAIGYSRIYLAAHYLGDVICGSLWGAMMGYIFYKLTKIVMDRFN